MKIDEILTKINAEFPNVKRKPKRNLNVFDDEYVKPTNKDLIKHFDAVKNGDNKQFFFPSENKRKLIRLTELLYYFKIDEENITKIYDEILKRYSL